MQITVNVNNREYSSDIEPRLLLSDYLRDTLGLTGTKVGCETGECGACTVLLNGIAVKSCMVLAAQANGGEVVSVEGLAHQDGRLNYLQEGFMEQHGLQCGFCTPGMLMSLSDLLKRNDDPAEADIRVALEGNLCRCTGYQNVVKAVRYAVEKAKSPVKIVIDTPGKQFYLRQVQFMLNDDADGLVEENYHDDAVLTSPEFIVTGKDALKKHFQNYMKWVKIKEVISTDKFAETGDTIQFEATVRSNYGIAKVYDAFVLKDGKISYHFTGVMK
jgi:aerobic carbon-monoxide dehydrogenase small subunit